MSRRKTFWLAGLLALLILACTAGAAFLAGFSTAHLVNQGTISLPVSLMPTPTPASPQSEEDAIQLFWDVWDIVRQSYYGDIPDIQTIIHGAIRGSLQTLGDQYTSFIEPRIAAIINEDASGEFQGIGAYVRMRDDGKLEIAGIISQHPRRGGPASRAATGCWRWTGSPSSATVSTRPSR
jgi:carboxyl-terminal processing protease